MATRRTKQRSRARGEQSGATRRPKRSRWLLRRLVFLSAMGLVVWFAPALIGWSGLCGPVISWAVPQLKNQLTVGSASLGWLSPVELGALQLRDTDAAPLLKVARVRTEKTLLQLLANRHDLGRVHVEQPHATVTLRPGGSNVEDVLRPWLQQFSNQQDSASVDFGLEVTGGGIEIVQAQDARVWVLDELKLSLDGPDEESSTLQLRLTGAIRNELVPGRLSADLSWTPSSAGQASPLGTGQLHLTCAAVPLEPLETILHRCGIEGTVSGHLESDMQCSWDSQQSDATLSVNGRTSIAAFSCAVTPWFGEDQLHADSVAVTTNVSVSKAQLHVEQAVIDCDLGRLQISGSADVADLMAARWQDLVRRPMGPDGHRVTGQVDLARLAKTLPHTLSIRDGTELTSGHVQFEFTGSQQQGQATWQGSVQTSQLAGLHDGRTVRWERPLQLLFTVRQSPDELFIEQLRCQSDVLQLTAQNRDGNGTLSAAGDLTKLASELDKFFDLRDTTLAGRIKADVNWRYQKGQDIEAGAELVLDDFQLATRPDRLWQEKQLTMVLSTAAETHVEGGSNIQRGSLRLTSAADQLQAELTQPVRWGSSSPSLPVRFAVRGNLTSWLARLRPWYQLPDWRLEGSIQADGVVAAGPRQWDMETSRIELRNLVLQGHGLNIHEPLVRIETGGTWDIEQGQLFSKSTTLASSALAFRASEIRVQPSQAMAAGRVGFRADLARLSQWLRAPNSPSTHQFAGAATGEVTLTQDADAVAFDGQVGVTPFQLSRILPTALPATAGRAAGRDLAPVIWRETKLSLSGAGRYDPRADRLFLTQTKLATDALLVTATGMVDRPASERMANLQGQTEYDLAKLTHAMRAYLGDAVQVTGRRSEPFTLQGPLSLSGLFGAQASKRSARQPQAQLAAVRVGPTTAAHQLTAETRLGWDSANFYGLGVGPNDFSLQLKEGVVNSSPWNLSLSQGRVTMAPRLELNATPTTLVIDAGTLADNVRLTPQMCHTWLRYVAPMLADATQAEGRLSLAVSEARLPVTAPHAAHAIGTLTLHEGQVLPGPLAKQFLTIAQQVIAITGRGQSASGRLNPNAAWMSMSSQQIEFQVVDGRVHHRGLEVQIDDVTIRTQGSVGLDQSLALLAEVPIRDQWVQRDRYLSSLRGQSLRIPVSGTLSRPRVDSRAVQQLSTQLIGGAAERLIQDELQNHELQ